MYLKKIFTLQQYYKEINEYNRKLKKYSDVTLLKNLKKQFDNLKLEYNKLNQEIDNIKSIYTNLYREIDKLKEHVKKDEYVLYNEAGSNIKLIESLQKDIKENKDSIETMENQIIGHMTTEEGLLEKKDKIKSEVLEIREKFYKEKCDTQNQIQSCKDNIKVIQENIKIIKDEIPEDMLKEFNRLVNEKGTAICKVNEGICDGCKIAIACETLDKLKINDKITYCDNCGRILYKED